MSEWQPYDAWPLQGPGQMRRNSVYSAMHEEPALPNVPVSWYGCTHSRGVSD